MLLEQVKKWRHVFKLDPNKKLSESALKRICMANSDALIIGGTDGITYQNTAELLDRVKAYDQYCVQEISTFEAVVPGFDGYLIPAVLNTTEAKWFLGAHVDALQKYGDFIPWDHVLLTAYITCNPEAKVSHLTKAKTNLDVHDMITYVRLADRLYHVPIFYIEYSGVFGDIAKVAAARQELITARLFYGGGLSTQTQVQQMASIADTVIIGNLIYTDIDTAIQTVKWVEETEKWHGKSCGR